MDRSHPPIAHDIEVETRGEVSLAAPDYARARLLAVVERLHEPVLAARVKLTQESNHAVVKPAIAQAVVDLNGRPVRAHVAAATMQEAVDLLRDRLSARLARVHRHRDSHRTAVPADRGAWDDEAARGHRPLRRALAPEERRVVRHKTYSLPSQSARAAVFEMEAMDYDFHLFTDAATGCDSVVYRDERTDGHRLAGTGPVGEPEQGLTVSTAGVPDLTVAEAVSRLDLTGLPFVFFTDTATGRGNVLYHRYDGHYGLITPVG
ncbi:HPF/RaiA family ribosome-associated protein [Kitasatospora sp. NPDC004745]|uniref:ribosome hibernation promotion factor n=1 Tax=unclassified Kitasatospora TaxID=2633591 RepID=UPI0033EC4521